MLAVDFAEKFTAANVHEQRSPEVDHQPNEHGDASASTRDWYCAAVPRRDALVSSDWGKGTMLARGASVAQISAPMSSGGRIRSTMSSRGRRAAHQNALQLAEFGLSGVLLQMPLFS